MMRWKILEMAGDGLDLKEILTELEDHAEFGLDRDAALYVLHRYKDILPQKLRDEINASSH